MRHRKNKLLKIRGSVQKRDLVMRNMLTSLIKYGYLTTTQKKAKVLIAYANSFFSRVVRFSSRLDELESKRELDRYVKSVVFGKDEGKKVVNVIVPLFQEKGLSTGFLSHFKLGKRLGDSAETVKIQISS